MSTKTNTLNGKIKLADKLYSPELLPYDIDVTKQLNPFNLHFDDTGVACQDNPAVYHPVTIAQYALSQCNKYMATNVEDHRAAFLTQASWLIKHEVRLTAGAGGWPISCPHPDVLGNGSWLSALAQGCAISVLVRAYQLTQDKIFLHVAQRAVRTFERDILDGGISTSIGKDGVFFEEVAVYPATHKLSGCIFAILGLYDYVTISHDTQIEVLLQRCLATVQALLDEYGSGFWTYADLLHRELASPAEFSLQAELLDALATFSGCEHCSKLAAIWKGYQVHFIPQLCYKLAHFYASVKSTLKKRIRQVLLTEVQPAPLLRVCIPIHSFPVTGGMRAVLNGVAQVTSDVWQIEYVTQNKGPERNGYVIHKFGKRSMSPWQFPMVWLYFLAGLRKLISLMRQRANYHLILPQDGIFTAAFAGIVGRLTGRRVVCIDHGNLSLLDSRAYRVERMKALRTKHWLRLIVDPLLFVLYWPSLHLFARIAVHCVDHFLIPGVEGDGVEETCKRLGVSPSHITRFTSMIDVNRYAVLDPLARADMREKHGIAADAIVITTICRLSPEKGLGVAFASISQALSALSPVLRERIRVIIAGDGPLRKQVEEEISKRDLSQNCLLWGEASAAEVISLLGLSDIFLYTSTRGACFSMSILEAMASGCAVIASTLPIANASLLAQGRGIAVPPGDAGETSMALVRLLNNLELCRQMGSLARDYIAREHNANVFKRALMRVTYWSALDELLNSERVNPDNGITNKRNP